FGRIKYRTKSMKVWNDLFSTMSDHRPITCEILGPRRKAEGKKEELSEEEPRITLQKRNVIKWRRRDGGDRNFWNGLEREADTKMKEWRNEVENHSQEEKNEERYC